VPYLHGWPYSAGQHGRPFSWLSHLARGVAASAKGDGDGRRTRLGRALHQERELHQERDLLGIGTATEVARNGVVRSGAHVVRVPCGASTASDGGSRT
jgi:hypothetical protein